MNDNRPEIKFCTRRYDVDSRDQICEFSIEGQPNIVGRGESQLRAELDAQRQYDEKYPLKDKPSVGMPFGEALSIAREGRAIARAGWNGKSMWVTYSPGSLSLPADRFWAPANKAYAEKSGGSLDVLPCLTMKTADNKILMGWLASQTDMLANDWYEVTEF